MTATFGDEFQSNQLHHESLPHVTSQVITIPAGDLAADTLYIVDVWDMRTYRRMDVVCLIPEQEGLSVEVALHTCIDEEASESKQFASVTIDQTDRIDEINSEALASAVATKNYRPAYCGVTVTPSDAISDPEAEVKLIVTCRW